jgi:hypothetical protein
MFLFSAAELFFFAAAKMVMFFYSEAEMFLFAAAKMLIFLFSAAEIFPPSNRIGSIICTAAKRIPLHQA